MRLSKFTFIKKGSYQIIRFGHYTVKICQLLIYMKVIITLYNLPPEMCMSKPYIFLSCLILGPSNPKASIDVYLEP